VAHLLLVRPGFEDALIQEAGSGKIVANGAVLFDGELPSRPFLFERQRIPNAQQFSEAQLKPIELDTFEAIYSQLFPDDVYWSLHAYSADPEAGPRLSKRVQGIDRALQRHCRDTQPACLKRFRRTAKAGRAVLQLCLTENGLWTGVAEAEALSDLVVGGQRRMKMDPDAPSRSYLKMEEALSRFGEAPQEGQTVVDLGAAPGGWSWSFLKRGCSVTAIDHGPLKLVDESRCTHLMEDGLTFPPRDVDWMVSDMLIPPGKALGVVRNWLRHGGAKRLIFNVKIPQENLMGAVTPLFDFLHDQDAYSVNARQLFHDRREVTVWLRRNDLLVDDTTPSAS